MSKIREWLRQWRRYRLVRYIEEQREYQAQEERIALEIAGISKIHSWIHADHANNHAYAARRAELELKELDNGRI